MSTRLWRRSGWRWAAMCCLLAGVVGGGVAQASCMDASLKGVNLAGAEFASQKLPGVLGTDYAYPSRAELAYFRMTGMNTIRLPFRWERIQRALLGPLDTAEVAQINRVLGWARELNLCVVLDLHNYGSYRSQKIGSDAVSPAALEAVWLRIADAFPDDSVVAFGLMNEPAAMKPAQWITLAQSTVLALRRAGAQHLLLVGSGRWSGAHEWDKPFDGVRAAEAFALFKDPLKRYAIELHQYADSNYSGTTVECMEPYRLRLTMQALARWSQAHRVRFFMGEFGMGPAAACLTALRTLLEPMQDNRVWLGWTYWAAGARWGNYPFSIHPGPRVEAPQLTVLRSYLQAPAVPTTGKAAP